MPTGGTDFLVAAGIDAATAGAIVSAATPILEGAGIGGLVGGVTGGGKGFTKGLELGALTAGGAELGGSLIGSVGGIAQAGSDIGGAIGGGIGGAVTGGNPLVSAAEGGIGTAIGNSLGTATLGTNPATGAPITGQGGVGTTAAPVDIPSPGGDASLASDPSFGTAAQDSALNPFSTANSGGSPGSFSTLSSSNPQTLGTSTVNAPSGTPAGSSGSNAASVFGDPNGVPPSAGDNTTAGNAGSSNSAGSTSVSAAASPVGSGSLGNIGPTVANAASLPTPAAPPVNTIQEAWNNPGGTNAAGTNNILAAIGANAAPLAAGVGLAGDALMNNKALKGERQIQQQAGQLAAQGQTLQQYLQTGTLPPGLQGALDDASAASIATIKSQYAAHGMSGSSAEQDAIANVQQTVAASGAQMALQLLQTGIGESEGAAQLYQSILNSALQQDATLGAAIGRFATSAAGGNPGISLNIGQAQRG